MRKATLGRIVGWLLCLVLLTSVCTGAETSLATERAGSSGGTSVALIDDHSGYVLGGLVIFTAQLALIGGLLIQCARRRRAEAATKRLEARNTAVLRAIPDVIFVLRRDGTYLDYQARNPRLLFAAPEQFLGRTIRDTLPLPVAAQLTDAIEVALVTEEPVVVEYELPMTPHRYFEARLVKIEPDRVVAIIRDLTEARRVREVNRSLAGKLISSQEAERTRIARDLHDGVCQEIASVTVDVSYLRHKGKDIRSPEVQELLFSLERRAANVAETLRLLSHGLHPTVLQHIGLVPALQAHCAEVERQHHVEVTFFADDEVEPVGQSVALSLFRITQEALRNAARHGHARHATVSLERHGADLRLIVSDDGGGFDVPTVRQNGGLGLVSIEERARMVHGQAAVHSLPGRGTRIDVRIPVGEVGSGAYRRASHTDEPAA